MALRVVSHQFAPQPERFGASSISVALLAHGLLLAALTWGINWRNHSAITTASAELWAELPVQAAPALIETTPSPAQAVVEKTVEQPPEIATEKAKTPKKRASSKKELKTETTRKSSLESERQQELIRQENIRRMAGLAGATGASSSTGTALQSAAPSASYAGKVEAKIRPNITFAEIDSLQGNPAAEVDIRIAPDGTIVGTPKLVKSSGVRAWDAAVLRAIEKTETLPKDTDGRVPSVMTLVLRPKR